MRISDKHMEMMLNQITLDCNQDEAIKIKDNMYIAPTKVLEGSRVINKLDPFFRAIICMGKAYIMADEETIPGWVEILKDYPVEWFFNYGRLRKIDRILNEYEREIIDTHVYFLPDKDFSDIAIPDNFVWFDEENIAKMKDVNKFHNALCYSPTQPDVMAVGAVKEGCDRVVDITQNNLMGMAGASNDGKYIRQIGIDVLDDYRGRGLAVDLVKVLKQKIISDGYLPLYGTGEGHALSRTVGVKAGFLPAYAEIFVGKIERHLDGIYG